MARRKRWKGAIRRRKIEVEREKRLVNSVTEREIAL
jgi:hypothetical protein